ncbi:putative mediator of RNA polymerase II transcription subunit 26 [Rhincodon typus]|uniref:putative mediator of RNA polymerase II transcription subunit 26 n=1 Tax=Rhincodon typus TaxID=259920 RepID=UPI00203060CB|nr:putative mediator of RNA polymerase II transcription subunit 26 [Rhincodon typus]
MHQQQQQLQLQQQQQKHLQHQFVLQHRHQQTQLQQPQPQQTQLQQPQLIHTSTQLQPLPAQQPQSVAVQPSAQTQTSVHPQAQHCQTVVQQKHQALHLQGAHPPSPVLQPVAQAQQSLQSGSQPAQPDGLLNSHGQTHQTHQHQLAPQTTAVNLQIQPAAHVIQQCQRSSQDIGRREKLDTAVEKGPSEKATAQTAPQTSTCLATSDQKKTESTKSITQATLNLSILSVMDYLPG